MSYKKRARKGWSTGKSYKEEANRAERKILEEPETPKHRKKKKKLSEIERLKKRVKSYENFLDK